MTIVVICLAIIVFMPILVRLPVAWAMNKAGGYDNKHPRAQQQQLTGLGARAQAAHENCFEATSFFAPTILLVLALNAVTHTTAYLALAFVLCRIIFVVSYWFDWDKIRSVAWVLGMATIVAHYFYLFG